MIKKILLITLGLSIAVGGFWAGQAQDPAPQNPSNVRTDPPTVAAQSTQTDLSGTYTGTFNCEELGLTGDNTLTITGNEFTLADGRTGRLVTSTTKGYTAVALQLMPAATPGAPAGTTMTPQVVSLRAKKSGNRLTLSPASGAKMKCSFVTRNVARGKQTPAATGTEVSNPAAVPTESPMPSQTPSPSPSPTASPTPEPTPVPNPSPSPTTTPTPVPSPGEPTPSPTASPTPTPSPSPRR